MIHDITTIINLPKARIGFHEKNTSKSPMSPIHMEKYIFLNTLNSNLNFSMICQTVANADCSLHLFPNIHIPFYEISMQNEILCIIEILIDIKATCMCNGKN